MVNSVRVLEKYFKLDHVVHNQFDRLGALYQNLNHSVNVISRRDIDSLYLHHVLHSLSITKVPAFQNPDNVLDLGTGGGFPGIPLAIYYPECTFTLIDGTRKKIEVVQEVVKELGLKNVETRHIRAEDLRGSYQFIVSRAVAKTGVLIKWSRRLLEKEDRSSKGGLLLLKGGDLTAELRSVNYPHEKLLIAEYFEESYFTEKCILFFTKDKLGLV